MKVLRLKYIIVVILFAFSTLLFCSPNDSLKHDVMQLSDILGHAYELEESGQPEEVVENNGASKVLIIPTYKKKAKNFLENKKDKIKILCNKISSHIQAKENIQNIKFVKLVLNLDHFYLCGEFFDVNFNPHKVISETELEHLSEWILNEFYTQRMPKDFRKKYIELSKSNKIISVMNYFNFVIKKRENS